MPHSGTRTLVKYLGIDARTHRLKGGVWWHFGASNGMIQKYGDIVHAHIPVRNPMDVAKSWAQRGKKGHVGEALQRAYQTMFEHIAAHGDHCTFHRMEGLPRLAGINEHKAAPDNRHKIRKYQEFVRREVIEPNKDFFLRFYTEDELDVS